MNDSDDLRRAQTARAEGARQTAGSAIPDLVGIGAPKSGTTWLCNLLRLHPALCIPLNKDSRCLFEAPAAAAARYGEMRRMAANQSPTALFIDFSVDYLSSPEAMECAQAVLGDKTRFIVILRRPEDQILSNYWHLRRQNFHTHERFASPPGVIEALERWPKRLLDPALYGQNLTRWMDAFGRDRFYLGTYEGLKADPTGTVSNICNWLGIPPPPLSGEEEEFKPSRANRKGVSPRSPALEAIYRTLYVWTVRGPWRLLHRVAGSDRVHAWKVRYKLRERTEALFYKTEYPALRPVELAHVKGIVAADQQTLRDLLGRDLWQDPA